jgi:hypothetical protein
LEEIQRMEFKDFESVLFENDLWFDEVSTILSISFYKLEMNSKILLKLNQKHLIHFIYNHSYMIEEVFKLKIQLFRSFLCLKTEVICYLSFLQSHHAMQRK